MNNLKLSKNMKKKVIIGVGVVIIILLMGVGFWKWENMQKNIILQKNQEQKVEQVNDQKQESTEQTQENNNLQNIDTSNWKTYRSEDYGFEVKYPQDWELVVMNSDPNKPHKKDSFIFRKERHLYFAVFTNGGFGYGTKEPKKISNEKFRGKDAKMYFYENPFPSFINIYNEIPNNWNDQNVIEIRSENANSMNLDELSDIYDRFEFIK